MHAYEEQQHRIYSAQHMYRYIIAYHRHRLHFQKYMLIESLQRNWVKAHSHSNKNIWPALKVKLFTLIRSLAEYIHIYI